MSLLPQPAQNLNSLEFIITSIGLISSHHLFTTFSHVKAARNVCKTLSLALHELTHRSRAERTMSYVERRRKGARVVTKARQWNVVHVVTVLRRHYDCIVKTTSLKKQFFQLCSKQHISATIFRNRFDPILIVFKKNSYSHLPYFIARYFKKGIRFKHKLSYVNYFGFAGQLWCHGTK